MLTLADPRYCYASLRVAPVCSGRIFTLQLYCATAAYPFGIPCAWVAHIIIIQLPHPPYNTLRVLYLDSV